MEAGNNSNSKHKPISYSENSSRDGTTNDGNKWHVNHREHRRDHGKNRDRGREKWNRDKSFHGKRENSRDEESLERFTTEHEQVNTNSSTSYPGYNYSINDRSYMENNRNYTYSMMSYNMIPAGAMNNTQWQVNSMDNLYMAQNNMPSTSTVPTTMEIFQASAPRMPYNAIMGVSADYNVLDANNYKIVNQYGIVNGQENFEMVNGQENIMLPQVKKKEVTFSKGILVPPNPNTPAPSIREKPVGCKTIFVGGLPERITEDIIREIFEKSGEIHSIRMSKKKFCHIRFKEACSVEKALYYSGYRMKIDNSDEPAFTGRLHVDYAVARDDQYEFECQKRTLQRVARHHERDCFRSTTPPITHYTEHESALLGEKLRNEETFLQAASVLMSWLDKGECNKQTSGSFYSMIQSTNSHVKRLQNEKEKYESQLTDAKENLKKNMLKITYQFYEIEKVFKSACLKKVWDHFTKPQRKNIEIWKKEAEEIKRLHLEEVINEREDEEMELSDDENADSPADKSADSERITKLIEENSRLQDQLMEASETLSRKDQELSSLYVAMSKKRTIDEVEATDFHPSKSKRCLKQDEENEIEFHENLGPGPSISTTAGEVSIGENDARLIGLISTFLHVHPFGANIDYICSYLQQINSTIQARDVENLMKRYQTIFREDSTGIGASLGKKWRFLGFES